MPICASRDTTLCPCSPKNSARVDRERFRFRDGQLPDCHHSFPVDNLQREWQKVMVVGQNVRAKKLPVLVDGYDIVGYVLPVPDNKPQSIAGSPEPPLQAKGFDRFGLLCVIQNIAGVIAGGYPFTGLFVDARPASGQHGKAGSVGAVPPRRQPPSGMERQDVDRLAIHIPRQQAEPVTCTFKIEPVVERWMQNPVLLVHLQGLSLLHSTFLPFTNPAKRSLSTLNSSVPTDAGSFPNIRPAWPPAICARRPKRRT